MIQASLPYLLLVLPNSVHCICDRNYYRP